ncbi:MAG: hypothetical protein KY461_04365 [Actinobacteria bacterium]|nr:hypothetical protein [Actinomycetota bacterium]
MDDRYRRLHASAHPNGGFWLREDARAAGFSDTSITDHVSSGRWCVWFGHVLAPAGMPQAWEQRVRAAFLRIGPDAVLTGRSAARLWQLAGFDRTEALEFLVPRDHTPRIPGIRLSRDDRLREDEVVAFTILPRVANVTRTLRSLARLVPEDVLARAAADGFRLGRTSPGDLQREILAHPGVPGNPRLSRVVRRLDPRMARAREVSETDVIETLVAIGVDGFEVNVRKVLGCGRPVEVDILLLADDDHDEAVLEVDGDRYHGDVLARRHDAERRRAIRADGYPVEVVPARHARDHVLVTEAVRRLRAQARR